ncbi:uncharacterized protein LOC111489608 isoform X5 [Cucurbita maxima]|uniref:Uncharacterized protein LOC111489608 isoform X5 n=1 Tax=Cucurbita maxima TaxID=3661 RepID=A0A6J1JX22_CUCMA|nr:uncharacterized protein LOC111489608 isoform X5 [Cucurbita maxima]
MGSSRTPSMLLLSCILVLLLTSAKGEEVMGIGVKDAGLFAPLKVGKSRKLMIDINDYRSTGPNIPGGPLFHANSP